jgi:hypothetical protein
MVWQLPGWIVKVVRLNETQYHSKGELGRGQGRSCPNFADKLVCRKPNIGRVLTGFTVMAVPAGTWLRTYVFATVAVFFTVKFCLRTI